MNAAALEALKEHARTQYPREACGLLVDGDYFPCENQAKTPAEHFVIGGRDYLEASKRGKITAVCHTHPDYSAQPSDADRASCEATKLPWFILSWPSEELVEISPCGYVAPLVGRQFVHGVHDCFSIVRDYYKLELGIEIPNYERRDEWWDNGEDLYRKYFAEAGFQVVNDLRDLRKHDGILMQVRSPVPNHAAVYIDEGKGWMLHHLHGQLSVRTVYGGYWLKHTSLVLRHRSLV